MTYNNYLTDCLTFAKETAKWAALDHYSVYTTNGSGWKESCDNNNGGIDVKWAFHCRAKEIRDAAPQHYADAIIELVQLGIDDEWDAEAILAIRDTTVTDYLLKHYKDGIKYSDMAYAENKSKQNAHGFGRRRLAYVRNILRTKGLLKGPKTTK